MTLGHLVVLGFAAIGIACVVVGAVLVMAVVLSDANGLDDEEGW